MYQNMYMLRIRNDGWQFHCMPVFSIIPGCKGMHNGATYMHNRLPCFNAHI